VSEPQEFDLHDVEVQFISFVPRGANKKQFLVVKEDMLEDIVKTILETPNEDMAKVLKQAGQELGLDLEGEGAEALVGASKLLNAYRDALPENSLAFLSKCTGLALPEIEKVVPGKTAEKKSQAPGVSKELLEKMAPEVKSLFEKMVADSEKATERAERAESIAKSLQDEKILKEYVEKAGDLLHLPIEPLKFGPVLKALGESHPKEFEEIFRVLKAADAAIEKSELFRELGKAGSGESSAEAAVYARARSIVSKDGSLTFDEAVSKILDEDPELYERYEDERQASKRRGN